MPMFKRILQQAKGLIQPLQPCQLCHAATQQRHNVCADCWNSLPWLKSHVLRQEMQVFAACQYAYPLDRIIQQFKYEQQLQYRPLLSGLLKNLHYPKVHAIVPMPVSLERLNQRGYNQSLLLAKDLAQHLQLPVWQPVQRLKQHSQKGLSRLERLEGIQQQFVLSERPKVRYRNVLIVDDVVTTGSSIHALKQSLEQLGCRQIHAVCLAAAE